MRDIGNDEDGGENKRDTERENMKRNIKRRGKRKRVDGTRNAEKIRDK